MVAVVGDCGLLEHGNPAYTHMNYMYIGIIRKKYWCRERGLSHNGKKWFVKGKELEVEYKFCFISVCQNASKCHECLVFKYKSCIFTPKTCCQLCNSFVTSTTCYECEVLGVKNYLILIF